MGHQSHIDAAVFECHVVLPYFCALVNYMSDLLSVFKNKSRK